MQRQPRPEVFASLVQSSFGGPHGNFEAVIKLSNNELWHYWRDNTEAGQQTWKPGIRICQGAAYAGSLIQSHFGDGDAAGNLEVVVPLTVNGQVQLTHYWRDDQKTPNTPWAFGAAITAPADQVVGPGCIIQSSFGGGNFEVIVPIQDADHNTFLQHFYRVDPADPTQPWHRGVQVTQPHDVVTGPGCIIQSSRGNGDIQIVVPIVGPKGNPQLRLVSRSGATGPWQTSAVPITEPDDWVAGGAVIVESDYRNSAGSRCFEVLVGVRTPAGHIEVRHLQDDGSDASAWKHVETLTASGADSTDTFAVAGVAMIQSDFPDGASNKDFEAVLAVGDRSLGCYLRYNPATPQPHWSYRATQQIVDYDPYPDDVDPAHDPSRLPEEPHVNHYNNVGKICQLIGEYDLEGWTSRAVQPSKASAGPAIAIVVPIDATPTTPTAVIAAWPNAGDGRLQLSASAYEFTPQPEDTPDYYAAAPQTSDFTDAPPALAARAGTVFMAWKGLNNQQLNAAALQYTPSGWGGAAIGSRLGITAPVTPATDAGPALTVHRGQLVLAWKGVGNGFLNIAFWQAGTPAFANVVTLQEVTIAAPALVSHNDRLLVSWTGSDFSVNIAELPAGSSSLANKVVLPDTTFVGPALASFQNRLFLAVTEAANKNGSLEATSTARILASDDNGQTFHGRPRTPQTCSGSTSLAVGLNRMFWAWTQDPVQQVNVARYVPPLAYPSGTPRPPVTPFGSAFNQTETRAGIRGTDLGSQFMYNDRMCFLFGDTSFTDPDQIFNLDTIAFADMSDFDPAAGLRLTFNPQPPIIKDSSGNSMKDSQKAYSVPLDAITVNGAAYLFYSLDSVQLAPGPPAYQSFGHTDVVKSADEALVNFTHLYQFSSQHFLNVSIAQVPGATLGLPDVGDALAVWGTGIYHSSEPYLAVLSLSSIETGQATKYFGGMNGDAPIWVTDESAAAPLFQDPTLAELSVRFNPYLNVWMMTYTSVLVHGVCLRMSATPWGQWSTPLRLQHEWWTPPDVANKPSNYVHAPNNLPGLIRQDWMYDQSMQVPDGSANVGGIPYSPAVIEPLIQGQPFTAAQAPAGASTTIFYTMSTWSPYTSLLMRADLQAVDLPPVSWPPDSAAAALTPDQMFDALAAVNIDYSHERAEIVGWLGNPYTEYPRLAQALLALLAGKRFQQPVYIDVINGYYENDLKQPPPVESPTAVDINMQVLPFAVVLASNDRHSPPAKAIAELLQ
jgi:hypothetical protein